MLRQVLDEVRTELADFFCEDRDSFKLEECFKLFLGFCQRFRQGVLENEHRRQHELAAENRRRQREEQLALKRRQSAGTSPSKRKEYQLIMLMFSYIFSNSGFRIGTQCSPSIFFPHLHVMQQQVDNKAAPEATILTMSWIRCCWTFAADFQCATRCAA